MLFYSWCFILDASVLNGDFKMCKALATANYFLAQQGDDAGDAISNLKLQKLLYYAQGFYLAMFNKELFKEDFEAWEHGPVIPALYRMYKKYGAKALPVPDDFDLDSYTAEERSFLNEVYDSFGQYSAWALRELSHQTTPWSTTPINQVIPKEAMKQYFKTQLV